MSIKFSDVMVTKERIFADGFKVNELNLAALYEYTSPVLNFDHFEMAVPFFPPHPHSGFSAVTYMLESSESGFINRDSLGDHSSINPGDLHWTLAGSGVIHEEVPFDNGKVASGMQLFVKLSQESEFQEPTSYHVSNSQAPRVKEPGAEVKILSGRYKDKKAMFDLPNEFNYFDISIVSNELRLDIAGDHGGLVYVLEGSVIVDENQLETGQYVAFLSKNDSQLMLSSSGETRLLLLNGKSLKEKVYFSGPFGLNDQSKLAVVKERYRTGELGYLEPSF